MADNHVFRLEEIPVHLGHGATVAPQEPFTGTPDWYERSGVRTGADGVEGRLVSLHTLAEPWTTWEMHPLGEELVLCTGGAITLHQEVDGEIRSATLEEGDATVNPPGVWHTADVDGTASALFVTAGTGTEIRPR
jgi:quercetin dioxygenase-like cupin family protein